MQSISSNLDPSVLATTLAKTPLEGNVQKIASILITCCKFLAERMEVNSVEDAQAKIETLVSKYINLRITWVDNKKNQQQLCLVDLKGIMYQTGICIATVRGIFFLWLWNNPKCAFIEAR